MYVTWTWPKVKLIGKRGSKMAKMSMIRSVAVVQIVLPMLADHAGKKEWRNKKVSWGHAGPDSWPAFTQFHCGWSKYSTLRLCLLAHRLNHNLNAPLLHWLHGKENEGVETDFSGRIIRIIEAFLRAYAIWHGFARACVIGHGLFLRVYAYCQWHGFRLTWPFGMVRSIWRYLCCSKVVRVTGIPKQTPCFELFTQLEAKSEVGVLVLLVIDRFDIVSPCKTPVNAELRICR